MAGAQSPPFGGPVTSGLPVPPKDEIVVQDARAAEPQFFTFLETVTLSIFGKRAPEREWTPLRLDNITEGWNQPFIGPPNGSGGALRQGWINTNDAFFNRMAVGVYSHTNANRSSDGGTLILETPLSRRYLFGIIIPAVDHLQAGGGNPSTTQFGDIVLENRVLLVDTQDFILSANLNVQIPTGQSDIGNHRTILDPYLAWWSDIGRGFSFRGTVGTAVPVDSRPDGVSTTLNVNLALGQTLTPHKAPLLGDFTYYVVANYLENLGTANSAFVSITPGFRTHLGRDWYLLGGIEVPVTGPKPFQERFSFVIVKGF